MATKVIEVITMNTNTFKSRRLVLAVLSALLLGGCASFSEDGGFDAIQSATQSRIQKDVAWSRDEASRIVGELKRGSDASVVLMGEGGSSLIDEPSERDARGEFACPLGPQAIPLVAAVEGAARQFLYLLVDGQKMFLLILAPSA